MSTVGYQEGKKDLPIIGWTEDPPDIIQQEETQPLKDWKAALTLGTANPLDVADAEYADSCKHKH